MRSEYQWELIGQCKHCKGNIYYNESEGRTKFTSTDTGCLCELEEEDHASTVKGHAASRRDREA
jgi:hypothetical protein